MRNNKRFKHFKGYMAFIVLSILGSFLIITFSLYEIKQKELQMLSSQLYNQSPLVVMSTHQEDNKIINTISNIKKEPFTIFYEVDELTRGYYFNKKNYIPPLIEGRFFEEEDFFKDKKTAVVGKSVNEFTIKDIKESGYEVIGIMGTDYQSDIDHLIYYNLDSLMDLNGESKPFIVVSDNNEDAILDGIKEQGLNDLSIIKRNDSGTFNFITDESFQPFLIVIIFLLLAIFSFTITYFYYFYKNNEIKILWLMGIHYNSFFKATVKNIILVFTCIYLFICLFSLLYFVVQSQRKHLVLDHLNNLFIGYLLLLLFSTISIIYFYIRTVRRFRMEE
ncbi:ABC transporter permease [Salipaludibacillus sp. LMS25]|jgi:hypothetical protein|uniref:ABC transporter permease n=1 Tax=Salipaludibacillus sp. LMS25 TaxID=2924031 RepID=UPI0020CFF1B2|nr:ABC transporter permease [Salipaludibacillus sp. LMS25]UTR15779.1 ABC transporter permease [Salipaludibacillus sp. LMS25]